MSYMLIVAAFAAVYAGPGNAQQPQNQPHQARQFNFGSPYPLDSQFDYTLIDPQVYYSPLSGENTRLQPQVLVYPGGAPGQPFLLQPGAPPGNFLIPQPHPGVILRDPPNRPPVFVSGYPKPAYVPPINKDAEEIPTSPGAIPPFHPEGRKPEKLESFDEKPQFPEKPTAREPEELDTGTPQLKPGHRYFILNGQPLFSNYPLPPFGGSPFQPTPERFNQNKPDYLLYRNNGPTFLPNGFNKPQFNDIYPYKAPVDNFFLRNSITGQINSAKQNLDSTQNDISAEDPQNFLSLNRQNNYKDNLLFKSTVGTPSQIQNIDDIRFLLDVPKPKIKLEKVKSKETVDFKASPIDVPDEEVTTARDENVKSRQTQSNYGYEADKVKDYDGKDSIVIEAKLENINDDVKDVQSKPSKFDEGSVSQAEPSATALAGPGGVASAAPRGTALTGENGLAVSSPQATAIAGPSKDELVQKPTKSKKGKQ